MPYQRQYWNDYDESVSETINIERGAVVTPERMNNLETGIVNNHRELEIKKADKTALSTTDSNVTQLQANKVDKGGNEQVTLPMLSQAVKEAMTGGSVAVVGQNGVNTSNIVDKSVTRRKISFYQVGSTNDLSLLGELTFGGYYMETDGAYIADSAYATLSVTDFKFVKYIISGHEGGGSRKISFWSESNTFIGGISWMTFTPQTGTKTIKITLRLTDLNTVTILPEGEEWSANFRDPDLIIDERNVAKEAQFDEYNMRFIDKKPSEINKFYKPEFRDGGSYRYTTGAWEPNNNYFTSNHVQVKGGDIVRTATKGSAVMYTNFWDAEGNWLSGINKTTDVTVPANAATVTCTFNASLGDTPDNVMITVNLPMPEEYVAWYQYELSKKIRVNSTIDDDSYLKNDLKGKTLIATGDSIVSAEDRYGETITGYIQIVADYFGMTLKNYAVSGSTIAVKASSPTDRTPISTRFDAMDEGDIIYLQCGTNDCQYQWTSVGTMSDRTVNTFYGALHVTLLGLMTKYPGKQIVYGLPIKRRIVFEDTNDFGLTLKEYCEIIKEVCGYYSIPVIDLYNTSMLNPHIAAQKDAYLPDGTHPNRIGHEILAKPVISYFKNL